MKEKKTKYDDVMIRGFVVPVDIYNYPLYTLGRLRAWWERGKGHQSILMVLASHSDKLVQKCEVRTYDLILVN